MRSIRIEPGKLLTGAALGRQNGREFIDPVTAGGNFPF
jgi:hypothetical protein